MSDDKKGKAAYQAPVVMPLGELAKGEGQSCHDGGSASNCNVGGNASNNCNRGSTAGNRCGLGNRPGRCSMGFGATSICSFGFGR
jgi:hypothetical protein